MDTDTTVHNQSVARYYRYHSLIYDATRWSFLFGRKKLLHSIPDLPVRPQILEVGCGTGKNLKTLDCFYPNALIHGVDISEDMLNVAGKKLDLSDNIILTNACYGSDDIEFCSFDLILLSYSFTMLGDRSDHVLRKLYDDLKPGGCLAVVDFNSSPFRWFRKWMKHNHVNLSGKLLSGLEQRYHPLYREVKNAYLGLWSYFLFIGRKPHRGW